MKLNTYILKDYLDMPVEQAILHSDPLERNLEMISFYENQAINTSSIYIINGNDLSDLIKRGKNRDISMYWQNRFFKHSFWNGCAHGFIRNLHLLCLP